MFAMALALSLAPVAARAQGIAAELQPAYGFVAPGAGFDVDLAIPVAGSAFNGFHAAITYDPAALTFVPAAPVSGQIGCLMNGGCSAACGLTFHIFHAAGDSLTVDLSLLCDQVHLTGPGQVYRLHFVASNTDQVTDVKVRSAAFYDGGVYVNPLTTANSHIVIGSPAGVGGSVLSPLGARVSAEPNPAHGPVALSIAAPADGVQSVDVLDLSGRLVRQLGSGWQPRGSRRLQWDGADAAGARLPAGVYLVRLRAGAQSALARVTLVR
jgi:hypothetical protein